MVQEKKPDHEMTIRVKCYDDGPGRLYSAWIESGEYRGCVESGETLEECLTELGITIKVLEHYRKTIKISYNAH